MAGASDIFQVLSRHGLSEVSSAEQVDLVDLEGADVDISLRFKKILDRVRVIIVFHRDGGYRVFVVIDAFQYFEFSALRVDAQEIDLFDAEFLHEGREAITINFDRSGLRLVAAAIVPQTAGRKTFVIGFQRAQHVRGAHHLYQVGLAGLRRHAAIHEMTTPVRLQLFEDGRKRLNRYACPPKFLLEVTGVADCQAVICADVDEYPVSLVPNQLLNQQILAACGSARLSERRKHSTPSLIEVSIQIVLELQHSLNNRCQRANSSDGLG